MSKRWESVWAKDCAVELVTPESVDDEGVYSKDMLVLAIGDPWASAYAVFGDRDQLRAWAVRVLEVTSGPMEVEEKEASGPVQVEASDDEGCECDGEIVPGACPGFHDRDEVQACNMCQRFDSDEDAAKALADRVGGAAIEKHDPTLYAGAYYFVIENDGQVMTSEDMTAVVLAEVGIRG